MVMMVIIMMITIMITGEEDVWISVKDTYLLLSHLLLASER